MLNEACRSTVCNTTVWYVQTLSTRLEAVDMESNTTVQHPLWAVGPDCRGEKLERGADCRRLWLELNVEHNDSAYSPQVFSSGPAEQLQCQQRQNIVAIYSIYMYYQQQQQQRNNEIYLSHHKKLRWLVCSCLCCVYCFILKCTSSLMSGNLSLSLHFTLKIK